jgi:hypothetical protein
MSSIQQGRTTPLPCARDDRLLTDWVGVDLLDPPRRNDLAAAELLPDASVLYARARGGKDGRVRVLLCRLPDISALANQRNRWTRRRPPLLLVLPADKALVKDLTLPSDNLREVALMVSNEVETLSPFEVGATQYGFVRLGSPRPHQTAVRCFLVEQAAVASVCEPFDRASIPVCGLVPSALASVAGLQGLADMRPGRLYMVCQNGAAEAIAARDDGVWLSRVGLLGGRDQASVDLAREVLTSLSVFALPAAEPAPHVRVAGLQPGQVQELSGRLRQLRAAPPVDLKAVEWAIPADVPDCLQVPAMRLVGALWLQRTAAELTAQACFVPQTYRASLQRRRVLREDVRWLSLCLGVGLLSSAALALGNIRMERVAGRIQRQIAPYVGVASQVAAKREQLMVARRQLDHRDQPLRILAGLAEVTPNGVFFYKLSVDSESVLVIDGVADSLHLAFEFPEYLRKSPLFTQIQLNYAQQSKAADQPVVEFRCTCRAQPVGPAEGRG